MKLNHIYLKSEIDKKQKTRLVNFLLSDALALILSGANLNIINEKTNFSTSFHLLSWLVAVFDERRPADCNRHILSSLSVLDEAVLYIVLLAVFFLKSLSNDVKYI